LKTVLVHLGQAILFPPRGLPVMLDDLLGAMNEAGRSGALPDPFWFSVLSLPPPLPLRLGLVVWLPLVAIAACCSFSAVNWAGLLINLM
jgi:hypothetical protein